MGRRGSVSRRGLSLGLVAAVSVAIVVPVAWSASAAAITPSSIAGAKLGLGKAAYTTLLGTPVRFQAAAGGDVSEPGFQQPGDYTRLVFAKRRLDVYFKGGVDHAIEVTTWNKAYRTAEGVGPCSTLAQLEAAYGKRLKPDPMNSVSYVVGRSLIFMFSDNEHHGTPSRHVTAVALYDGSKPNWNKPYGALAFAAFTAVADQVPCDHS